MEAETLVTIHDPTSSQRHAIRQVLASQWSSFRPRWGFHIDSNTVTMKGEGEIPAGYTLEQLGDRSARAAWTAAEAFVLIEVDIVAEQRFYRRYDQAAWQRLSREAQGA